MHLVVGGEQHSVGVRSSSIYPSHERRCAAEPARRVQRTRVRCSVRSCERSRRRPAGEHVLVVTALQYALGDHAPCRCKPRARSHSDAPGVRVARLSRLVSPVPPPVRARAVPDAARDPPLEGDVPTVP
jgi:hypothetical protein